jgi:hypothetical protein
MKHLKNILTFQWLEKLQAPCERREVRNLGALGDTADWVGVSGVGIPTKVSCKDVCMPINILRALVTGLALGCTISAITYASLALGVVAATIYTLNLTVTMFGASAQQVSVLDKPALQFALPQYPDYQVPELDESESLESAIQKYAEECSRTQLQTFPSIEELNEHLK